MNEKKKILHICMTQYSDGWTYQENFLTKYHKILGLDVTILTSQYCYKEGKLEKDERKEFWDINGNHVIRLAEKNRRIMEKIPRYVGFKGILDGLNPDIIFLHGCQYIDSKVVAEYVENNSDIELFVDNHADFSNSARNWISLFFLHKLIWKYYANKLVPYTKKFWGVLPARVDFLIDVYGVPKNKCGLLVMGADDEKVKEASLPENKNFIRQKYNIDGSKFLIVTGGKIDSSKQQLLLLAEAIYNLKNSNICLLIFGSIEESLKEKLQMYISNNVKYIGWIDSEKTAIYFAAADLVVFPGRHSVFWEQVVALGIPMVVKYWEGTQHIDLGGNLKFLYEDSVEEIKNVIEGIISNKSVYKNMWAAAQNEKRKEFLYSNIAKKSIGLCE